MATPRDKVCAISVALALLFPACALAQQKKSEENPVTSADDAFGTTVGLESTGIYSENNVRGFSPRSAGNERLNGIYFDPAAIVTLRIKAGQSMRVGYAALQYPFPAPTGIVDIKLRSAGNDLALGLGLHLQQYGSYVTNADLEIPVIDDTLSIAAGAGQGHAVFVDGKTEDNISYAVRPVLRLGGVEVSPFYAVNKVTNSRTRVITLNETAALPALPESGQFLGTPWALGTKDSFAYGTNVTARVTDRLTLRGGIFKSIEERDRNFTEILYLSDNSGDASHILIADPEREQNSVSGEAQIAYRLGNRKSRHFIIAGYRARDRYTESGGSDILDLGRVRFGEPDDDPPPPSFNFSPVDRGTVKQTSLMLGYLGKIEGLGLLNLGLQRADFKGRFVGAAGEDRTREKMWLYNASLGVELGGGVLIYAGTQRGLEDSGLAPESAANRNEQLPPTRSTQYEAGIYIPFQHGSLVVSVFDIEKPYFSFDADNRFTRLGTENHRGIEASFSGHFLDDRLNLLLGVMAMSPTVSGNARDIGLVGKRPPGTRPVKARLDANYKTDLLGGLITTLSTTFDSRRAISPRPLAELDGKQLYGGSAFELDIGFRLPLDLKGYPATLRGEIDNVFKDRQWYAVAGNTLIPSDTRYATLSLLVDF